MAIAKPHYLMTTNSVGGRQTYYIVTALGGFIAVILFLLAKLQPSRYTRGNDIYWVFAAYLGAKLFETLDRELFVAGGIGAAKRFMVRTLHEVFGPDADSLTGKVELAQTSEDLRKLAEKHRELMASMGSRRKADTYWQGIEELLPAP